MNSLGIFFQKLQTRKIKYQKAKTLEQATAYARDKLGILKFEAPDLETANQINYTLTKAYNKTGGKVHFQKEILYESIESANGEDVLAQMSIVGIGNWVIKSILKINKDYFENIDKYIRSRLKKYENYGQIYKDSKGRNCINLVCKYKYADTLNRYYRLYQEGKLTTKAKVDFDTILMKAGDEEELLLSQKRTLAEYIKSKTGIDISGYSEKKYNLSARRLLLSMKNKMQLGARKNSLNTQGTVGLDGIILHEQGHLEHAYSAGLSSARKALVPFDSKTDAKDIMVAHEVSKHSARSKGEAIADIFAGKLSNDKYSENVEQFYKNNKGPSVNS